MCDTYIDIYTLWQTWQWSSLYPISCTVRNLALRQGILPRKSVPNEVKWRLFLSYRWCSTLVVQKPMCRRTRRRCGMPRVASESASSLAAADTSALAPLAWCTRARPRCIPGCIGWCLCPPHPPRRGRLEASAIFKIKIIFTCVQYLGKIGTPWQLHWSLRKR